MRSVEVVGLHVEESSGVPLLLLRELDEPRRVLPLFIGDSEAEAIGRALLGAVPSRPLTHDVMAALVRSLDVQVEAAELTELRDGAFVAELALSGPAGGLRLDARPSDAIALALRLGAPLYVSETVLDEAGEVIVEQLDEDSIEEAVGEFRVFLAEVEPADFHSTVRGELPPGDAREE